MNKKILFLINGEGLGNSTRCHAIIQKLLKKKVKVGIVAAKNSYWYFSKKNLPIDIFQINQLSYHISENGNLSTFKTLFKTFKSFNLFKSNLVLIKKIISEFKPDIILSDSNYVFSFLDKFKIPVLALNNSCLTLNEYKIQLSKPFSIKSHYYFIEKLDFFYHTKFPNLSISCGITHKETKQFKNFHQISPIYREDLKQKKNSSKKICMIMMSGASNLKKSLDLSFINDQIIFLNSQSNYSDTKNFKTYSKIHDNLTLLNSADYFIINSGYSAITEAIFMKKPMISIPIENHSEQWLNAKKIEDNNYGLTSSLANLGETYKKFSKNFEEYQNSLMKKKDEINGAEEAASLILEF